MKVIQKRNVLLQALNPTFIDMTWLILTLLALILIWLILIAHEFPIQGKFISVDRSCHLEVFCKKGALENFAKVTRKYLCQSLCFNKVAELRPETLAQAFSCEFCEIFKNTLLRWLLHRWFVRMFGSVEIIISLIWKMLQWLTRYFC